MLAVWRSTSAEGLLEGSWVMDGEGVREGTVVLHAAAAEAGSRLGRAVGDGVALLGAGRSSPRSLGRMIADVSAPPALVERHSSRLGAGAARPEALAALLGREEASLEWGEPVVFRGLRDLARFASERGRSSIGILRADPMLLPDLQLGSWFDVRWPLRALRRLAAAISPVWRVVAAVVPSPRIVKLALDAAFWSGARSAASPDEWRRLTRSSYTALYYHRIAGELKAGQERIDISPERFDRQVGLLRRLGFTALSADEVMAFHESADVVLPRRSYVVTVDDGFLDAVEALGRYPELCAQVFVCTGSVGGRADWAAGERVAGWDDLVRLADSGAALGSHGISHTDLTSLSEEALQHAVTESRRELEDHSATTLILAYPHGQRNDVVRRAVEAAGFRAAYTTQPGRNAAGTSRYDLRRIGPKEWDSTLSFLWKVVTGELVPARWEQRLLARARRRSRSRRSSVPRSGAEGGGR
jgi:peptidoglycan/xylan/chitin deacetylase (PgdA/CDA1 family)